MPNERDSSDDGASWDGPTVKADFAGMWANRIGLAICQGGLLAGRLGNLVVDVGADLPADLGTRRARLNVVDANIAEAIGAFGDIIEQLRDARAIVQEHARNSFTRRNAADE